MIEIKQGDLLDATEQYICHQTNCMSTGGAAGIARAIFDRLPYADCYTRRTAPDKPGTIDILGNGKDQRFVINVHAQLYPGGPHDNYDNDSQKAREKYFYQCLLKIAKIPNLQSIAFNYFVGCGIGGGDWKVYLGNLTNFETHVNNRYGTKVAIYRRIGD